MKTIRRNNRKRWIAANDWSTCIELNKEYLRRSQAGMYITTPYYQGPLDAETKELIPDLLHLHDYGLLTTGSQPARSGQEPPIREADGSWYQYKQLPFVDFLIPYKGIASKRFLNNLVNDPRLTTQIIDYRNCRRVLFPGSFQGPLTMTSYRRAESRDEIDSMRWVESTALPGPTIPFEEVFFKEASCSFSLCLLWCIVTTKRDINLLETLKEHAANAGLSKN